MNHVETFPDSSIVWFNSTTYAESQFSKIMELHERNGYVFAHLDVTKVASAVDVVTELANKLAWPDFVPRSPAGIQDWLTESFETLGSDTLIVVFNFGDLNMELEDRDWFEDSLFASLRHIRSVYGKNFPQGGICKWRMHVWWISHPNRSPACTRQQDFIVMQA